jgi:hypothetical protein
MCDVVQLELWGWASDNGLRIKATGLRTGMALGEYVQSIFYFFSPFGDDFTVEHDNQWENFDGKFKMTCPSSLSTLEVSQILCIIERNDKT